jgi:streptogramin lyase
MRRADASLTNQVVRQVCAAGNRGARALWLACAVVPLGAALAAGCSNDGEGSARRQAALTVPVPPVTQYVVLATRSATFGDRTQVTGGHLGIAQGAAATPGTLTAGQDSSTAAGRVLLAQTVVLRDRATTGEIGANQITAPTSVTTGPRSAYVAPPPGPTPAAPPVGTTAVTVNPGQTQTLAAGRFAAVTVNGTLNLSGGLYEMQSLQIGAGGRISVLARSTVHIATGLGAADRAVFLPVAPLRAADLHLTVNGTIDTANNSVSWGVDGQLTALVVARNTFRAGDRFVAAGAIAAQDVILGLDAKLAFDTGFACGSNASCDDANACTTDTCLDALCVHTNVANGTACTDGNACTRADSCQAGTCVGSNPVMCTASDQCHVAGVCDPASGVCSNPAAANGTACTDGSACTRTDTCQAGACVGSNPVVCTASDQCHVPGVCNPASGACSNPAAANGTACTDANACTQRDSCQAGVCVGGSPVVCAANDQCHVAGVCDPVTGACSNPAAANGTPCTDGNACTRTDTCQAGACAGGNPVVCAASDQCHAAGACNPANGTCSSPPAPDGTSCTDGNACTRGDACRAGACVGGPPVTCAASDQCHVAGACDPASGVCSNPAAANGTPCSDANACTQRDACQAGTCVGASPVVCTANDQCHVAGVCDPVTGACSNPAAPDGAACTDRNACTQNDVCRAGACVGSSTVTCAASDQCHAAGTCDPATGACSSPNLADGTSCDDHDLCTAGDACRAGVCGGQGLGSITEVASGVARPTAIVAGEDGNLWFISPESADGKSDGSVVRIVPSSGTVTSFPTSKQLVDITPGFGSDFWLAERLPQFGGLSSLGTVTTAGTFLPDVVGILADRVGAGTDGLSIWFTSAQDGFNLVGSMIASSDMVTNLLFTTNSGRYITGGPDGAMWLTESNGGTDPALIGRVNGGGRLTEFPVATPGDLNVITSGPDGNLWFTDAGRNEIGRITTAGVITKFPVPTPASGLYGIVLGPDGNLWFTEASANRIGRITPAGSVSELGCIPTPDSGPSSIASGSDGRLWFTETSSGRIGAVRIR